MVVELKGYIHRAFYCVNPGALEFPDSYERQVNSVGDVFGPDEDVVRVGRRSVTNRRALHGGV
jgi:hypothetical protein